MTDVLSMAQVVLENAGYQTWIVLNTQIRTVGFEDQATMGFVCSFDSAKTLIERWRDVEATILARHSIQFRAAGDKAWNVYTAFLTDAQASEEEKREVRWIEEDLERTRKLTATGVQLREDATRALLPLLPVLAKPLLPTEDARERLLRRADAIAPQVRDALLDDAVSAGEVAVRLRSAP
ncbi:hypothetical protein FJ936_17205 [Mesorhizobium sp. B2-4-13]|uniref:hypothetical protein n=1 Tax=Mesorhizobium sp. B2-4-13 TaxID=2589936 RepID=UPI00114DA420|nr:hypothetical protein [Mesorhizobium sp. B2-4-13]TPK84436.1 hypothetical protein FJ936_17205 [Mesorhizobium sp. B2-4-13]